MSFRNTPQSIPEQIADLYEKIRRLQLTPPGVYLDHQELSGRESVLAHEQYLLIEDYLPGGSSGNGVMPYTIPDMLMVETGHARFEIPYDHTLLSVYVQIDTAPTGASAIFDVHRNGTTIFTTQANRPTVAAGTNNATSGAIDLPDGVVGDYYTVDVDQVGSTNPGAWAIVHLEFEEA